ncbi:helix-turn-helix transcriptional regulator [Amycolatopsis sp. YIM 10]|uniref:helix-turn-helix domain-containing protein n=1 Tax=Amycolatopsis sp. YIM 10 TaxID=2653857 RepID=UPI001290656D|nr:helix-turn-helix transcriptional regulator [Amycolatopsis sp. YIM 10]QFU86986.1 hypothetical protein YIM_08880 [Amycolatopsis sp. YIM 10]
MVSSATKSHLRTLHHEAAPAVSSPSKQLSDELRQYRDHVGMTPETAAEHLSWPQDRLTQTELGTRRVPKADLDALIRLYEIDHREAKRLHTLRTRASKEPVTVAAPEHAPSLLPPICQVEAYAAELAEPGVPQTPQTVDDLAKYHVQQSQSLLNRRDPFELHVVLGEATLYNLAGTRRTMLKQLDHLIQLARVPHIKLQILPFAETGHAVVDTGYTLLTGANADTWLCTDSLITTTCTNDSAAVAAHQAAFSTLTARALDRQESIDRLVAVRRSHFTASQRRKDIDNEVCRRLRTKFKLTLAELAVVFDCSTETISLHLGRYQPNDALAEPVPSDTP